VVVTGEIDASTAGQLRGELYGLSRPGTNVVLDFASVTFIDAAGLGVLVSAARQARGRTGPSRSCNRSLASVELSTSSASIGSCDAPT